MIPRASIYGLMVLPALMGLWFSQHSWAYGSLSIDWTYVSPRINEPVFLPAFMGLGFPNINGAYGFHSIDGPMVLTALMGLWFSQH